MEYQDLIHKSESDLATLLSEKRQELRALRLQASERQLKNVRAIRSLRQTIARVLTAVKAKGLRSH